MEILELRDGYDRRKTPAVNRYRRMTLDEIKALSGEVEFIARDGTARRCRINGRIKTWKTDPARIEVPVKYGMYECVRMETREALDRLIVRIPLS